MKKLIYTLGLVLFALQLTSCKEEIDLNIKYVETPVIVGLLDQGNEFHYIKINRGFTGPGNALEFAKIPDSNYFEKVSAKVEEIIGGQVARTWQLRDTLLNDKATDGAFFGPTYKAYYFHTQNQAGLDESANYKLTVDINEGKVIVTGETQLVTNFALSNNLSASNIQLRFAKLQGEFVAQSVSFAKGTSAFANAAFTIKISEYRNTVKDTISIPWNLFEGETSGSNYSTSAQGQSFYQLIKAGLTNDASITKRNLEGIEITFTGGSNDLFNYIAVTKPSSSLAQNKPTFTNLKSTGEAKPIGIFSARSTVKFYRSFVNLNTNGNQTSLRCIDQNSTREMCQGGSLINSLFCSQHVNDNTKDFKCN